MLLVLGQMSVSYLQSSQSQFPYDNQRLKEHLQLAVVCIWDCADGCAITVLDRADASDMSSGDIPLVVYTGLRFSPFALLAVPRTDKVRQSPLKTQFTTKKKKKSHLLNLMFLQTCLTFFLVWHTKDFRRMLGYEELWKPLISLYLIRKI